MLHSWLSPCPCPCLDRSADPPPRHHWARPGDPACLRRGAFPHRDGRHKAGHDVEGVVTRSHHSPRHHRACPGDPASVRRRASPYRDGRDKPGHDVWRAAGRRGPAMTCGGYCHRPLPPSPCHHRACPGDPASETRRTSPDRDGRDRPSHDRGRWSAIRVWRGPRASDVKSGPLSPHHALGCVGPRGAITTALETGPFPFALPGSLGKQPFLSRTSVNVALGRYATKA